MAGHERLRVATVADVTDALGPVLHGQDVVVCAAAPSAEPTSRTPSCPP
ncbi:hypothetical protein ACIQWR_27725 [Streptomyces sp. NPDC098789]